MRSEAHHDWWWDMLTGAVAGLAATYAMTRFHRLLQASGVDAYAAHPQHSINRGDRDSTAETQPGPAPDDATVEGMERMARAVGFQLTPRDKQIAGPLAHYLFGATVGAAYGLAASQRPGVTAAWGLPFGTLVWLVAEVLAVPAAGLAPPPHRTPLPVHLRGAAAHLVYGGATEMGRQLLAGAGAYARRATR